THIEWKVDTHMSRACAPTSSATRSRISAAALLVNVNASTDPGWAPRSMSHAIRRVRTRVLPDPAPAMTSSGPPSWVTAARWASLRPRSTSGRWAGALAYGSWRTGKDTDIVCPSLDCQPGCPDWRWQQAPGYVQAFLAHGDSLT